jgi:hypothetical protein
MSSVSASTDRAPRAAFGQRREHGVVLFIALLVMVALSLAAIALIRSADTATIVAGNLAFKQSAAASVDRSVETAVQLLFDPATSTPLIGNTTVNNSTYNYFACVQADGGGCLPAGSPIPEIPAVLITKTGLTPLTPDLSGNTSYYVIERMCDSAGPAVAASCNMSLAGMGAAAGTQHYQALQIAGGTFYRVTVRVEGPRNTVQYAQAMLK